MTDTPLAERVRPGVLRIDFSRLRPDVEALAAMERGSAAPEKPQLAWLEQRLREAGAHEIHAEPFRFQRRAWRHLAHFAAGLGASAAGGPVGAGAAVATLGSLELEVSGRSRWLAKLLPAGEGVNVVARIPAGGEPERTLVFVAHHDAQRAGLFWRLPRGKDTAEVRSLWARRRTPRSPSLRSAARPAAGRSARSAACSSRD